MGQRFLVGALCAILAVFMATPVLAQDSYPPDEVPEITERNGDDEGEDNGADEEEDAEVRGVSLEQDEPLARTGATIGVLAAVGAGVLVVGGIMLKSSRRRVEAE